MIRRLRPVLSAEYPHSNIRVIGTEPLSLDRIPPDPAADLLPRKERHDEEGQVGTITERVERGAALLDEKRPGWIHVIDLERLNIRSSCDCIGGQLGDFGAVMDLLGVGHSEEAARMGFDAHAPDPDLSVADVERIERAEFRALTAAWRDLIRQRREQAAVTA